MPGALRRGCSPITFVLNISHKRFGAMNERASIPLPADLADWLKREAERLERPVAYVARKAIEAARQAQERVAA
jgi:hypothetical protein